jgi:hypothetical protein
MALVGVAFALIGCPFAALPESAGLSDVETVTLADGVTVEVPLGAGAPGLADSTWAIYRAEDDALLFRIVFGSDGEVKRLYDSFVFAREWLGSEIIPDGRDHSTDFPGGSYVSGAYAAEQEGSVGVLGVLHGLLLGAHVGTATLSLSGTVNGGRIDGKMIRTVSVFAETPFPAPGDAEFAAYAVREE